MSTNTQYEADGTITRKCRVCKERKQIDEFGVSKTRTLGRSYMCKKCHRKTYRDRNRKNYRTRDGKFYYYWNARFANIKAHSKKRGVRAERTIGTAYLRELWAAQDRKCALTGVIMLLESNSPFGASMDRIDNSKGYVPGNVRLVTAAANYARNRYSDEQFRGWLAAVRAVNPAKRLAQRNGD